MIQSEQLHRQKFDGERFKAAREQKLIEITELESETIKAANEYAMAVRMGQADNLYDLNARVEKLSSQLSIIHL